MVEKADELKVHTYTLTLFTPVGGGKEVEELTLRVDEIENLMRRLVAKKEELKAKGSQLNVKEEIPESVTIRPVQKFRSTT